MVKDDYIYIHGTIDDYSLIHGFRNGTMVGLYSWFGNGKLQWDYKGLSVFICLSSIYEWILNFDNELWHYSGLV